MWTGIKEFFFGYRLLVPVAGKLYDNRQPPNRIITCYEALWCEPGYKTLIDRWFRIRIEFDWQGVCHILYTYPYSPGYIDKNGKYVKSKRFSYLRLQKGNIMNEFNTDNKPVVSAPVDGQSKPTLKDVLFAKDPKQAEKKETK